MKQTYIRYYFPGMLFAATASEKWSSDKKFPETLPMRCYAFSFYDVNVQKAEDGEELIGKPQENQAMMFVIGKIINRANISDISENQILLRNLENEEVAILAHTGNWLKVTKNQCVLDVSQFKFEERWIG